MVLAAGAGLLYGTPLWRRMSEEQRLGLARHEAASLASLGIWFEIILMQLLARHIYDKPLTSHHVRYALTEIADECRHSMMFARLIRRGGTPEYPVPRVHHNLARVLKTVSTTPGSFAATLLGEEILDWMQRLTFPDERVQPLVRGVTRIHVVEEARHVRYAREELRRQMVTAPRWERELTRLSCGEAARVFSVCFVNPGVYAAVGLDWHEAVAQVRASGHRREVMQAGAKRLTDFLDDVGLLRGRGAGCGRRRGCWHEETGRHARPEGRAVTLRSMTSPATPAYRRLSVEERRGQLLEAALGLFAHRTPEDVSLDDVAEAAGVSRPSSTATSPAASSSSTRPPCAPPPTP